MILIPEARLKELLLSLHPDATRLPPGWLGYGRLVELELQAYMEQVGWASPTGELYRSQIAMPRAEQDQARAVYAKRLDRPTVAEPRRDTVRKICDAIECWMEISAEGRDDIISRVSAILAEEKPR